jgi:DNA-binding NtrC family response regulator
MRRGAFDFITKPFVPEVLLATARRAIEHTRLLRENGRLRETVTRLEGSSEIRGTSAAIRALREKIAKVAPTNATVLITGETGTGKELVARAIHRSSDRASKPLVAFNCAAFTDTLLESELFGHERGAFTGADRAHEGLFEAAHQGTLFLDEAAEMSMAAQAKLLRVLTEGQLMRVGSTKPRQVDVRVIVATHRDLSQRAREGLFREDLYYRLAVVPLAIPPLRERREDLPELCQLFLAQAARDLKVPARRLSPGAVSNLLTYDFPGNIRELRNLIEHACILSKDVDDIDVEGSCRNRGPVRILNCNSGGITKPKIWPNNAAGVRFAPLSEPDSKRPLFCAYFSHDGAQAEAARNGVSPSDLAYKLAKYGTRTTE